MSDLSSRISESIYTAEESNGEILVIASWPGLTRDSFREHVLDVLERESIPEPDMNIQDLDLCEWGMGAFATWMTGEKPSQGMTWIEMFRAARYDGLEWGYPGEWNLEGRSVRQMPAELAAEFGPVDGGGYAFGDPKGWGEGMLTQADLARKARKENA